MNGLLDRLFGLEGPGPTFADADSRFGWAQPMEPWAWALLIAALAVVAGLSYTKLAAPSWARVALAGVRTLTLVSLLAIIAGPQLLRDRTSVERDWTLVLVDRSASLAVPDVDGADGRETRDAQLRAALAGSAEMWATLGESKRVVWLGFDAGVYELDREEGAGVPELADAEGRRTRLGGAIDEALRRAAARPVAGVVVFSDGRSSDEPGRATLRRLTAESIPVFAVPLGSADPVGDVAIGEIDAPTAAFVGDTVPVRVRLTGLTRGEGEGAGDATRGTVRLIDVATGEEIASEPVDEETGDSVTLDAPAAEEGAVTWRVVFEPEGRDLLEANNSAEVSLSLVDRPLRVLYIDGYPRWEHRYLKSLLLREDSIDSTSLLLAPDRRYQQEGDTEIDRLPISAEEWAEYDVVIIGDVRAELFGRDQLAALVRHVAESGGGLMWIAGPNATPQSYAQTPLSALIPVAQDASSPRPAVWEEAAVLVRAPGAERLGVLELGTDAWSDPAVGWSLLRYAQRLEPGTLKPGVEVLATAVDGAGRMVGERGAPAVVTMQYGAGRTVYVGSDETWRYRFGTGERVFERFWLPLIRLLARERLARAGRPAVLTATPERAEPQQPVVIEVELFDRTLLETAPETVRVEVRGPDGSPAELTLSPDDAGTPEDGVRLTARYAATWLPAAPGEYLVRANDPALAGIELGDTVEIVSPEDELRTPQADHPALAALAEATGGAVLRADQLGTLPELLPNRRLILAGTPETTSLWDTPFVLGVMLFLLGLEWAGRRLVRLT